MLVLNVVRQLFYEPMPVCISPSSFSIYLLLYSFSILSSSIANLDHVLQSYLEMWFPKEIKAKRNQNKIEAGKEEAQEMGMGEQKCIICWLLDAWDAADGVSRST